MRKSDYKYDVTVFIPTYNAEDYLDQVITAVMRQKIAMSFELLIIDSGSRDSTLNIINRQQKKHENIRLHTIPNVEFGHGRTRNLAAQMAKGKYVVYLSHDAVPSHNRWLYEMVKPFSLNSKIVGVMGKQVPRKHCVPMQKYEILRVFNNFGPDFGTTLFYKDDFIKTQAIFDAVRFYSDVNSAAPRDFLLHNIPYRDVGYAEDQMYGEDLLEAGYIKAYAGRGSVKHSNDLTLTQYKKRMFDETMGLRRNGTPPPTPSRRGVVKRVVKGALRDNVRILLDGQYGWGRKIYWWIVNPLFHVQKWRGVRLALVIDDDARAQTAHSLEESRKLD
jgi:rhamnosyltransferase